MSAAAWTIEGLTARLGGRLAVDGASLTARPGEVVGVLGANGSGKTTLLRAGLGLIKADAGAIRLGGEALVSLSEARRARLAGYLPQERRVSWNLAALEIAALGAPDQGS
jgi:iron complex transport system ATP-binding protein